VAQQAPLRAERLGNPGDQRDGPERDQRVEDELHPHVRAADGRVALAGERGDDERAVCGERADPADRRDDVRCQNEFAQNG
jgi:hypothetical protein